MKPNLKDIKTNEKEPEIPIKVLRKIVNRFNDKPDDYKLSFTYIMTACFPNVFNNIMSYAKDCYTQGYIAGQRSKNED
jgi:hypothetical protein